MIVRPTKIKRCTVGQVARTILNPSSDPAVRLVRVQVLVPFGKTVFVAADVQPEDVAMARDYILPPISSPAAPVFDLLPEQFLIGACESGQEQITLIIQHFGCEQ